MVLDTSNHWPYHTDLLVSCLKFRLATVCEYLNYCYNTSNDYWDIPEKFQKGWFELYSFLKKSPYISRFITLPFEILDKTKLYPCKFREIMLHSLEISRPKMKTYGNSTCYFLDQSWKFYFFFSWPMKFSNYIIYNTHTHTHIYIYIYIYTLTLTAFCINVKYI